MAETPCGLRTHVYQGLEFVCSSYVMSSWSKTTSKSFVTKGHLMQQPLLDIVQTWWGGSAAQPNLLSKKGMDMWLGGRLKVLVQSSFLQKSMYSRSMKSFFVLNWSTCFKTYEVPTQALSEKNHFLIDQKLVL